MAQIFPLGRGYPIKVFTAYSHKDEGLRDKFEAHLAVMKRNGHIVIFHDRRIIPGQDWQQTIASQLFDSDVLIALISPDFLDSDYCSGVELQAALARQETGDMTVVPVILRPCDWQAQDPLSKLQALPTDAMPISKWQDADEAFFDVTAGLRRVVENLAPKPIPTDVALSWSPSAMVVARVNRFLGGRITRTPSSIALVVPDQGVMNDSMLAASLVTDSDGEGAVGVPVTFTIAGGRIVSLDKMGDAESSLVGVGTTGEDGLSFVKIWIDDPKSSSKSKQMAMAFR